MADVFGLVGTRGGRGRRSALAAVMLILSGAGTAAAFDTGRYQPADLDRLAARKPALGLGADVVPVQSVRLDVTLAAQAAPCPTKYLKWAMGKAGIAKEAIAGTPISQCIKVKSAKGRLLPVFIQDALAGSLAKDVQTGGRMTIYADVVYFAARAPGIIMNEFSAQKATDLHSGVDLGTAATDKR
jgi:hypothetical protein